MMLFLIMLFTDLFMVGICFSVYGKATLYHDHMLLWVHIPEDKLETPSVTALIASYKKQNRHFYLIHLILGAAVSLLAFWYTSILIICWSIWLVAFFYGIFSDLYRTHRMLYCSRSKFASKLLNFLIKSFPQIFPDLGAKNRGFHSPVLTFILESTE